MRAEYVCSDGTVLPVVTILDSMPEDGSAVVVGDESGKGSLWFEWAHEGEVDLA